MIIVKCKTRKNYNLTVGKNYEVESKTCSSFRMKNDNGVIQKYSKDLFESNDDSCAVAGDKTAAAPEQLASESGVPANTGALSFNDESPQGEVDNGPQSDIQEPTVAIETPTTNAGIVSSLEYGLYAGRHTWFFKKGTPGVKRIFCPLQDNDSSVSCGIREIGGLNELIDRVNRKFSGETPLKAAMIARMVQLYADYSNNNGAFLMFSTNITDNKDSHLLSEMSSVATGTFTGDNPNSGNTIGLWIVETNSVFRENTEDEWVEEDDHHYNN